jgi:hypothetical protein
MKAPGCGGSRLDQRGVGRGSRTLSTRRGVIRTTGLAYSRPPRSARSVHAAVAHSRAALAAQNSRSHIVCAEEVAEEMSGWMTAGAALATVVVAVFDLVIAAWEIRGERRAATGQFLLSLDLFFGVLEITHRKLRRGGVGPRRTPAPSRLTSGPTSTLTWGFSSASTRWSADASST